MAAKPRGNAESGWYPLRAVHDAADYSILWFNLALLVVILFFLAAWTSVLAGFHGGGSAATGSPSLLFARTVTLASPTPEGATDPTLVVDDGGQLAVVASARGPSGGCLADGGGLAGDGTFVPVTGTVQRPVTVAQGRTESYCAAAPIHGHGTSAFAAVTLSQPPVLGTLDPSAVLSAAHGSSEAAHAYAPVWVTDTASAVYLVDQTVVRHGASSDCCPIEVWRSVDGAAYTRRGVVDRPPGYTPDPATFAGPLAVDPTSTTAADGSHDHLYVPLTHALPGGPHERELDLAVSSDGGQSWALHTVTVNPPGTTVAAQYPVATVDAAGTVYVVWSTIGHVQYAWSRDGGVTFSDPVVLDTGGPPLNVMPSAVAGDSGHLAVAWYEGTGPRAQGDDVGRDAWRPVLAISGDADSSAPSINHIPVAGTPVHRGGVCLLGTGCTDSGAPAFDDTLGGHLSLALLPDSGALAIAYVDDVDSDGAPVVRVVQEACGQRLLVRPPAPLPACAAR